MTPTGLQLRPEVEELVREIARRPDSVLLRAPKSRVSEQDLQEPAWSTQTGLASAERHLVAVHREEVAFALRQLAWSRLHRDVPKNDRLILRNTPNISAPAPDELEAARARARVLEETPVGTVDGDTMRVLESCVRAPGRFEAGVVDLCAIAHRLVPSFQARFNAGTWYSLRGRIQPGLVLARQAMNVAATGVQLAAAWELAGQLAQGQRRWMVAERASRNAIRAEPEFVSPYVALTWSAVQRGDEASARESLRELRALVGTRVDLVAEYRDRFSAMAGTLKSAMSPSARLTIRNLVDGSESLAGELFHAMS
jgi:hypothetical protein